MSKVQELDLHELAVFKTCVVFFFSEDGKGRADLSKVLFLSPGKDQDVIKVDYQEKPDMRSKDFVHLSLKDGWGVC